MPCIRASIFSFRATLCEYEQGLTVPVAGTDRQPQATASAPGILQTECPSSVPALQINGKILAFFFGRCLASTCEIDRSKMLAYCAGRVVDM